MNGEFTQRLQNFLPFWNQLDEADKTFLESNAIEVEYAKDMLIHGGGSDCIGVLLIEKGQLCTSMISEEGREIALFRLYDGDVCILAASCVISQITFDVQVTAEADTTALLINSAVFAEVKRRNVYVENFALKQAVNSFSDVMWSMQQILFMGFDRRLASYLYDESIRLKSSIIKQTHEVIARHVGSAREVVSRMLTRFSDDGIVKLSRGKIEITDKAKLKKLL